MYFQWRGTYYSFVYYDTELEKNVRLPRSSHPHITREEDARAFLAHWDETRDPFRVRREKRLEWKKKYYDFNHLLELYERTRREEAPQSYEENLYGLNHYVLPYFLDQQKENNVNNWRYHFETFREYLKTVKPLRSKKRNLSFATMNMAIKALNSFLRFLKLRALLEHPETCRLYSARNLNRRGVDSVMEPFEQQTIYEALKKKDTLLADFFYLSLHTGMRLGELMGISMADFFAEPPHSKFIETNLRGFDLHPHGYLVLDSQLADQTHIRVGERVIRKPLKGKRKMDLEEARIIPLFDKLTYNTVIHLWNRQQALYERKHYGDLLKDYLLFDGMTKSSYCGQLKAVQKNLHLRRIFSSHDCRHTYSTWLAEQTGGSYALNQLILGHTKLEMTTRYIHVSGRIARDLQMKKQVNAPLEPLP